MADRFDLINFGKSVVTTTGGTTANVNIDANTLFIDGTNNRVGVGTNAPTAALQVAGDIVSSGTIVPGSSYLRNRIINGDMRIDQRNAGAAVTLTSGGPYPVDRWFAQGFNSISGTAQQIADAPTGFTNSTRFAVTTANVNDNYAVNYTHRVEGVNMPGLGIIESGGAVLSFWVKSNRTGSYTITLSTGFRAGVQYTVGFIVLSYTINSANTWEFKTLTIPTYGSGAAAWQTNTSVGLEITYNVAVGSSYAGTRSDAIGAWQTITNSVGYFSGSTLANNTTWGKSLSDTWQITGVQLEVGSVATPFERRQFGQELMLCQRYYAIVNGGADWYASVGLQVFRTMHTTPEMRTTATAAVLSNINNLNRNSYIVTAQNTNALQVDMQAISSAPLNVGGTSRISLNAEL